MLPRWMRRHFKNHDPKFNRRGTVESISIHGLQTVILNKFMGYYPIEECWKQVPGSNVKQRVGIWNKIIIVDHKHNVLTNAGRDLVHSNTWIETNAANTPRGAGFIAL